MAPASLAAFVPRRDNRLIKPKGEKTEPVDEKGLLEETKQAEPDKAKEKGKGKADEKPKTRYPGPKACAGREGCMRGAL